MVALRYSANLV